MPGANDKSVEIICETLAEGHELSAFDCDDEDLNDFLLNDAWPHQDTCMAVTSLAFLDDDVCPVGYISLATDCISLAEEEWERILQQYQIKHPEYPAIKICRLAVRKDKQRIGVGSALVGHVIHVAEELQESVGLRFLSVDAYRKSEGFYKKLDFLRNLHEDEGANSSTISMRFELNDRVFDEAAYDPDIPLPLASPPPG